MRSSSGLTNCILEAFSNLSVSSDVMGEVQASILKGLDTVDFADLPCVVKFVLETTAAGQELEVARELREKLELAPPQAVLQLLGTQKKGKAKAKGKKDDNKDVDTMVLHVFR